MRMTNVAWRFSEMTATHVYTHYTYGYLQVSESKSVLYIGIAAVFNGAGSATYSSVYRTHVSRTRR